MYITSINFISKTYIGLYTYMYKQMYTHLYMETFLKGIYLFFDKKKAPLLTLFGFFFKGTF